MRQNKFRDLWVKSGMREILALFPADDRGVEGRFDLKHRSLTLR